MSVYEGSMEIDDCKTDMDEAVFSKLNELGVCNRNIAYLMKDKKVFSYDEADFEWEDKKITLKEDRIIALKKMRNLINYGFDALSAYLLEKEGYDGLAIDLINDQMSYDEITGILLLQDNDKNIGMPVIDEMNMERYDAYFNKGHKAIDTLVQLNIIEADDCEFVPDSEFYQIFEENEITLRNINRLVLEDVESDIEAKYEDAEDRIKIAKHISSYINDGIDSVSAATEVIDVGIKALDEIYCTYRSLRDSPEGYSPTEAFDKTFNCENLTRTILEQRRS
ncbi:MAG: hypothetical protein KAS90_02345 [Candidatus Aenigmarchaeota archaeon]|nr:hypothetical protein [Candidatus Aenigmarchaeota archaeon]